MSLQEQIKAAFAESDAQSLAKLPEVIERQRNTYRELKQEIRDAYHLFGGNSHEYWKLVDQQRTLFSQSFINDCGWSYDEHVARASKSLKKTHDRNDRIVIAEWKSTASTKLTLITSRSYTAKTSLVYWIIDGGDQVSIKVIWAGGYNIQCLHGVLVNVKVNKAAA